MIKESNCMVDLRLDSSKIRKVRILEKFCNHVLTPQKQSSERHLPETIVPWMDIFDKWCNDFQRKFWKVQSTLTYVQTQNVPWRDNCPWGVKRQKVTEKRNSIFKIEIFPWKWLFLRPFSTNFGSFWRYNTWSQNFRWFELFVFLRN